jgi:hypothetical protein
MAIGEFNTHGLQVQECRGRDCTAEIFFLATFKSVTPVDAEPVADGTVRVYRLDGVAYADVIENAQVRETLYPDEIWYRPHWAGCPNADDFRTRK